MFYRYATLLLLVAFLGVVWTADAPYLHDFGEWVFQSRVLTLYWTQPDQVAGFQWAGYPVPNILVILVMAVLGLAFSAITSAKIFLTMLLAGWYLVLKQFVRQVDAESGQNALLLMLFSLVGMSNFFWTGFVNYQLALLLLTLFLTRFKPATSALELTVFAVLIFLSHAMVFLVFALLVVLGIPRTTRPRHCLLALAPSAILSLWFVLGRHLGGYIAPLADASLTGWKEAVIYKLGYPLMMGPFKNLLQPDMSSLLDRLPWLYWLGFAANVMVVTGMGVLISMAVLRQYNAVPRLEPGRSALSRKALRAAAWILLLFYVFAPYNFFGLINPAGRLAMPLLLICLILLGRIPRAGYLNRIIMLLAPVTLVFTFFTVFSYAVLVQRAAGPEYLNTGPVQRGDPPSNSVLGYNAWVYSQARYGYFNYRIFSFSKRFQDIELERYNHLGFRTGLLVDYKDP